MVSVTAGSWASGDRVSRVLCQLHHTPLVRQPTSTRICLWDEGAPAWDGDRPLLGHPLEVGGRLGPWPAAPNPPTYTSTSHQLSSMKFIAQVKKLRRIAGTSTVAVTRALLLQRPGGGWACKQ